MSTRPTPRRAIAALFLAGVAAPALLAGQAVEPRAPVDGATLGGRVHLQLNSTSADGALSSEFLLRRARVWGAARINDWIDGAVQIDVSGGAASARYAFVRLALTPAARVSFGQFKRAFDLFELTSSTQILVVERDGVVRGAEPCAGIGRICSYSAFSERLLLSSLDVGVLVEGEVAGGRAGYLVSLTNGPGANTREENDAKSASARLTWSPVARVTVGANAAVHDYPNPVTGGDAYAPAFALDVEVGDFDGGLHVQAGVMGGENWRNLRADGDGTRFLAAQGIVAYRVPLGDRGRVRALEPLARVSWGDPARGGEAEGGVLLTPGLQLHFEGRNKVAANLDVWRPAGGDSVWSFKAQTYVYF